jgi:poly-gamma-glutamate synthesis protein (capsule biosynthesis protein)
VIDWLLRRGFLQVLAAAAAVVVVWSLVLGVGATGVVETPLAARTPLVSPSASPSPQPVVDDFTIVASGDLLIHSPIYDRALTLGHGHYDFRPMFAQIRPIIRSAALSICHVETPIGAGPLSGYPIFNAPVELAAAIKWTGWQLCSTAATHSVDRGQFGIDTTLDALDAQGIAHAGTARSAAEAKRITTLQVRGLKVAFLAYAYGDNGLPLPHSWSDNIISLPKIVADAQRARRQGARLIIVNFHWGDQYVHAPNKQQVTIANYLLRHRLVDVIIGQHVHVVQPIQEIAGRFVVFGEGNLISNQTAGCCPAESQDGLIAVVHVHVVDGRPSIRGVDYVPVWVEHPDFTVLPVGPALQRLIDEGQGNSLLASELRASYLRTLKYAGRGRHIRPIPAQLPCSAPTSCRLGSGRHWIFRLP